MLTSVPTTFIHDDSQPGYHTATNAMLAIAAGKVIEAIKILRCLDGVGLKEAKDVIEACMAGGYNRTVQRSNVAGMGKTDEAGTFVVIPCSEAWPVHSREQAIADAKERTTTVCDYYVAKVVVRTEAKVTVTSYEGK